MGDDGCSDMLLEYPHTSRKYRSFTGWRLLRKVLEGLIIGDVVPLNEDEAVAENTEYVAGMNLYWLLC